MTNIGTPRPGTSVTPRAGVQSQAAFRMVSPREFIKSSEKISEHAEEEKSGDKSKSKRSLAFSCLGCGSPKNRVRTVVNSRNGTEEGDEAKRAKMLGSDRGIGAEGAGIGDEKSV